MSLLHPTVGEMIDRIVFLEIKVKASPQMTHATDHFMEEYEELSRMTAPFVSQFRLGIAILRTLHEMQWDLVKRAQEGDNSVSAVTMQTLNSLRHFVMDEIDKTLGAYQGPEKV